MDAVVIQLNHITYAECGGQVRDVPCGSDTDILGDYWGTPAKDGGIFRGYNIVKADAAPTPDSIALVRLYDKINGHSLHVLGTAAQFRAACDGGPALPAKSTIPVVVPETTPCADESGNYVWHWGLPAKGAGDEYRAHVMYNNTQTTPAAAAGHADLDAIVTWLTTNYPTVGTWTNDDGRLKLVRATEAKVGVVFTVGNYA